MDEYRRVLPRDIFNEAKLLKCLGRLSLQIEDGMCPPGLTLEYDDGPFDIRRDYLSGDIYCLNLHVLLHDRELTLRSLCNSKEPYPLVCIAADHTEIMVFHDDGSFTADFLKMCQK